MSETNALYRVQFICHNERYEVYVKEVNQGQLFGFIEIANFVWDNHTALIVDPSHEKLKSEFADVNRTLIPMHQVLRIDQVRKQGEEALSRPGTRYSAPVRAAGSAGGTSAGRDLLPGGRTTPGCGSRRRSRTGRAGSPARTAWPARPSRRWR